MRFKIILLPAILTISSFLVGCSGTETPTNSINNGKQANANSNPTNTATNSPLGTTKTPEAATSNNAPTLTPVVQSYYAALLKKDEAGAKKFLSQAALKSAMTDMAKDKQTSLLAYLIDSESPVEEKREVRNEKIEGESAIAELKGGPLGVWTKIKFVKESGEWKFASPEDSPDFSGVDKTAANSNSGK